ncbi:hypothetical protein FUAX_53500 (plasmid) [Fulvitalea axinellae]|uniref:Uncharacterized protein n=1 Tax=Fulvitalea axinellae TaxID=1182444 RepID=A0AAU9CY93_9BACT|nr:hypothetical protein FUAX_53500 [Fulvitalea axinellae]
MLAKVLLFVCFALYFVNAYRVGSRRVFSKYNLDKGKYDEYRFGFPIGRIKEEIRKSEDPEVLRALFGVLMRTYVSIFFLGLMFSVVLVFAFCGCK